MSINNSLRGRLRQNLSEIVADPGVALNQRLLEDCEVLLPPEIGNNQAALYELVVQISELLPILQQDPTPLTKLLTRLVEPLSFADILTLEPSVDFVAGLDIAAQPYHLLLLSLLKKASRSSRDAAILAGMPSVVRALVNLWLCGSDMAVSDVAADLLVSLLEIDQESKVVAVHGVGDDADHSSKGQGLMWRRVFGDRDVYSLLFSIPSLKSMNGSTLGKHEKTIAQARLMAIIPRIGLLDWSYVLRSHDADIEREHGSNPENEGLLDFVALYMLDYKNDVLIHINMLQFFSDLLCITTASSHLQTHELSPLEFLKTRGLHTRAMSFWLNPEDPAQDPVDITFLYGPSAHYTSTYASHFPQDLLSSADAPRILKRLSRALDRSANQWAHGQSLKHDLNVLVSLPRAMLLSHGSQSHNNNTASPVLLLPCKITNPDTLHALAAIFSGREVTTSLASDTETITFPARHPPVTVTSDTAMPDADSSAPAPPTTTTTEPAAARALFLLYLTHNPTLFAHLITHADLLALPEKALASIALISALISAQWSPLPSSSSPNNPAFALPEESSLPPSTPSTALAFLLSPSHPARASLVPWLLQPPRTFAGLVGGRGDAEGAAYKVAVAKWECLLLFRRKLGDVGGEYGELAEFVDARVREGVWGARVEVGARVGTMEL